MDQEDIKKNSTELMHMLIQGTVALSTIQGIELGFFDWIPLDKAVTTQELSGQMGFDNPAAGARRLHVVCGEVFVSRP